MIEHGDSVTLIEVKLGSGSAKTFKTPETLKKSKTKIRKCIVTAAGVRYKVDSETECIPIWSLGDFLRED